MQILYRFLAIVIGVFFITVEVIPQSEINSPYSRYGIGDLVTRKSAYNFSMGGMGIGLRNPHEVNPYNPAANSSIDTMSFVFNGGIISRFGTMKTDQLSVTSNFVTLGYLYFGFPVTKWLKSSIGINPYSNVGYDIVDKQTLPDIGTTDFYYRGTGGINQFYLSLGAQLHKNLSVGITGSYLFGKANLSRHVYFPDSAGRLNTRIDSYIEVGDIYFDLGAQYSKQIGSDLTMCLGIVYAPSQRVATVENYLARTYFGTTTGVEYYRDTIESRIENNGDLHFPQKIGIGMTFRKTERWLVGADFTWQNWSKYEAFGVSDSLQNSMQFSVGGEYLPDLKNVTNYWKRVSYRFGFRYNQTYLQLRNTKINEFGITFGVALPIPRSLSALNLGVELGRLGTTANGLIQDNYVKISVGVAIWERWFVKRKYN